MLGAKIWEKTGLLEPQPPLHKVMPGRPKKKKRIKEPSEGQQENERLLMKRM